MILYGIGQNIIVDVEINIKDVVIGLSAGTWILAQSIIW